jgi:hypothetical protein
MLREWIRNIPLELVRQIAEDRNVRHGPIWRLAVEELARRQSMAA